MAADVRFLPTTGAHLEELAARIRPADRAEVLASGGYEPLQGARESLAWSNVCAWTAYIDGELAAVFGLHRPTLLSERGIPWMLTTDTIDRHPRVLLQWSRLVVEAFLDQTPILEQRVDARYVQALRWLARLGFEVEPAAPWGALGLPFHRVTLRRPHV